MKKNKTIEILKTISDVDLKSFTDFFNKDSEMNPQHKTVFEFIQKNKNLDFQFLNKVSNIKLSRIPYLLSEIQKSLERWIFNNLTVHISSFRETELLIEFYHKNNLDHNSKLLIQKISNIDISQLSSKEYLDLYNLHRTIEVYSKNITKREKFSGSIGYTKFLDLFFNIEKIKLKCEEFNRKNILSKSETSIELSHNFDIKDTSLLLQLYNGIIELLECSERITYKKISDIINRWGNLERRIGLNEDIYTISHYIINLLLKLISQDNEKYRIKLFNFLNRLNDENILIENNLISPALFKLCVSTAIKLDKVNWAEDFLISNSIYLPLLNRENEIKYLSILISYERGLYDMVTKYISSEISFDKLDIFQKINLYIIVLKIYLEKIIVNKFIRNSDYGYTQDILKNLSSTLRNNTMGELQKLLYENFIINYKTFLKGNLNLKQLKTAEYKWFVKITSQYKK